MDQHRQIWDRFCARMQIYESSVPLFQHSGDLKVETQTIGSKSQRTVLRRSTNMESMICSETNKLVKDWTDGTNEFDGLIYLMFLEDSGKVLPLYIGKAETTGKGNGNLSANLKNLDWDRSKFARWGDNYAYHIGDLSAAVLPGHKPAKVKRKYSDWAKALFVHVSTSNPQLKQGVYFWTTAWRSKNVGILSKLGPTKLTILEHHMIGVANSVFPESLLNREG